MENVVLIGFMGTGKSAVASCLKSYGFEEVLDMDPMIEEREGCTITEIFRIKGEEYFRERETELLKEIEGRRKIILSCGGGVVLREENVRELRRIGTVILLEASPEVIYYRVKEELHRPLLAQRMCVEQIRGMMEERTGKYHQAADIRIDTSEKSVEEICDEILNKMSRMEEKNV